MGAHTQIRLVQVTGSVVQLKPAAIATGPVVAAFGANDLSGSLQYFAQAVSNIHGNVEFGAQVPGTIEFAGANNILLSQQLGSAASSITLNTKVDSDVDALQLKLDNASGATVAGVINLTNTGGTAAGAIKINATAGGLDLDAGTTVDILAGSTLSAKGATGASLGDDTGTFEFDGSGNVTETNMATFVITPGGVTTLGGSGLVTLDSVGAANDIAIGVEGVAKDIVIGNAASNLVDINAISVDVDAAGALTLNGATGATFGDDTEALAYDGSGNVDFDAVALDIDASGALTMTSTTMAFDPSSTFDIDAAGAVTIDGSSITIGGDADVLVDIDAAALDIDASGGVNIEASAAGIVVNAAAGGMQLLAAGDSALFRVTSDGAGEDLVLQQTGDNDSGVLVTAAGTGADAIKLAASAGGIDVDVALGFDLDAAGDVSLDSSAGNVAAIATGANKKVELKASSATNGQVVLIASGTNALAIHLLSAGGIQAEVPDGKSVSLGKAGSAEIMLSPSSVAAEEKVLVENTAGDSDIAILLKSLSGGTTIQASEIILSGSSANAVSIAAPGMSSGHAANQMGFADYAEYATLRSKTGMSAATTVIGAINVLAGQVSGATATVFTGSIAATIAAGANVTVKKQAGDNATLATTCGIEKAQVYVNGQLLVSSSIGKINDYKISAADTLQFQFPLASGDLVMVIDRS
jgi:hypothetical protein